MAWPAAIPWRSPRGAALLVVGLAFFTDTLLYSLLPPLLPLYAARLGLSQTVIGVLFASYAVSLLVCTIPLGRLTDRVGRRWPFLTGMLGLAASTVLFAFARGLPMLFLARALQGLAAAATWVAGLALLADHFPADQRGRAMSTVFAAANVGLLTGPYLSGWMFERWGLQAPFLAAAVLAALDALARLALLPADVAHARTPLGYVGLLKNPQVTVFAGCMALGAGVGALMEALLPLHLSTHLRMSPAAIGLGFTISAVASTFTSPVVGHLTDRRGPSPILTTGLVLGALLVPVAAFVPARLQLYALLAGLGAVQSMMMSPTGPALSRAVEDMGHASYGSVFSILNMAFAGGMMVAPLAGSILADALGLRAALFVMAVVLLAWIVPVRLAARGLSPAPPSS